MEISGNTILVTGGSTGIGYALAESFLAATGMSCTICRTVASYSEKEALGSRSGPLGCLTKS